MLVWLYRSLGVVAQIDRTTSRVRLKGVPLNWIVMAGIGVGTVWQGSAFIFTLLEQPQPIQVSISDIKNRAVDYVTVQGHLFPESEFRLGRTQYIPLIEEDTRRAILIRANPKRRNELEPSFSSVTGRLRPINPEQQIEVSQADLGRDVYLETAWSLAEGTLPNTAWKHGALAGVGGLLIAAVSGTWFKRGIIFIASSTPLTYQAMPPPSEDEIDIHISAHLTLQRSSDEDERASAKQLICKQRFVDVPGTVSSTENGEIVLMARVDASSREGFAVTDWKVGWWKSAIASQSIHELEAGLQYLGGNQRPALSFRYHQPTGELMQAVLSFATPLQQQHIYNHLCHSIRCVRSIPTGGT